MEHEHLIMKLKISSWSWVALHWFKCTKGALRMKRVDSFNSWESNIDIVIICFLKRVEWLNPYEKFVTQYYFLPPSLIYCLLTSCVWGISYVVLVFLLNSLTSHNAKWHKPIYFYNGILLIKNIAYSKNMIV